MKHDLPLKFRQGVRLIMLIQRGKEGGKVTGGDRVAERRISRDEIDFGRIYQQLEKQKADHPEEAYRIYSSVNPRNIEKAIREFKFAQLEADYYDSESRNGFYFDVKNRWISALMKPSSRIGTLFLIDIDEASSVSAAIEACHFHGIKIIYSYETKNGSHLVTEPFNPNIWDKAHGEIKKDALILLDY